MHAIIDCNAQHRISPLITTNLPPSSFYILAFQKKNSLLEERPRQGEEQIPLICVLWIIYEMQVFFSLALVEEWRKSHGCVRSATHFISSKTHSHRDESETSLESAESCLLRIAWLGSLWYDTTMQTCYEREVLFHFFRAEKTRFFSLSVFLHKGWWATTRLVPNRNRKRIELNEWRWTIRVCVMTIQQ